MTREKIIGLPKIELHCHLDGSLSRKFMEQRLERELRMEELSVSDECTSLAEYLEKFELPGLCLRDERGLEDAGYDVLKYMNRENVCYAEIRFAPLLSVTEEMDCAKVIEAVLRGLKRGREVFGIDFGLITCAMRHHSEEDNIRMIKTAREYLDEGVCAADLAGAEASYPMSEFMNLFAETKKIGMPFTIHAGECGDAKNIVDAVEAGAGRIGHGIAMREYPKLQKSLAEKGIGVEMCPISNLQTKAVQSTKEYPILEFLDAGIKVSVNTDNRTVIDTTCTDEYMRLTEAGMFKEAMCQKIYMASLATSFADDSVKQEVFSRWPLM